MAEDSKSRFKSKWNRVFKEKEEHEQSPKHTNSFKLNDDVADFLKPSTDKAAANAGTRPAIPPAPKLNIAIAQRFPDANEVKRTSSGTTLIGEQAPLQQPFTPNGFTKPPRRRGLTVGFVKTEPEVIGEGGDEAPDPPSEVSRQKAMMVRSSSDRRPSAFGDGSQWPSAQGPRLAQVAEQARQASQNEDDFVPQPVRRVQTSHNEFSPAMQKRQMSPPVEPVAPAIRKLSRTPTGFGSMDEQQSTLQRDQPSVPRIETNHVQQQGISAFDPSIQNTASPKDPNALAARKRELRSGEGMILRRASAMITRDDDEDDAQRRQSYGIGVLPPSQHYEDLSREDAPSLMPQPRTPRSALSPGSAVFPAGPSPFADPKYLKRRSREVAPVELEAPPPEVVPQGHSARSSDENEVRPTQNKQLPYIETRPASWQQAPTLPQISTHSPLDLEPKPARQQIQKNQQHPQNQQIQQNQPNYMRAMQPPTSDFVPGRAAPSPSQNMKVPQDQTARSRDPSPLRDRLFSPSLTSGGQLYSRPNASNNSLNYIPPSPKLSTHSRASSRDGESPHQQYSAGSTGTGPATSRMQQANAQNYTQSPQSASPRSSTLGRPADSPSGRRPSPGPEYIAASKMSQPQFARSANSYRQQDDSNRPGSAGSRESSQRPVINFSAPRSAQVQQQSRAPATALQQDDSGRKSSADSNISNQRDGSSVSGQRIPQQSQMSRPAAHNMRQDDGPIPVSSNNTRQDDAPIPVSSEMGGEVVNRPGISPRPSSESNPVAEAAYADFASRVAHMRGVFRLTAEKEQSSDRRTPNAWLRTALWWYLKGKAGLEVLLQQRPKSGSGQPRELLTQPHVDLAKTWWILSEQLGVPDGFSPTSPQSANSSNSNSELLFRQEIAALKSHITSLSLSMSKSHLMPPPQSLIQGQDTRIWLEYPRFTVDATAVLAGTASNSSLLVEPSTSSMLPMDALPVGDTQHTFCYGRFPVEVTINTDEANTDRVTLPCMLTMQRDRRDFLMSMVIASQNELVNLKVCPRQGNDKGPSWYDVAWKGSSFSIILRLPRNFDLTIRMQERDYRQIWNLSEYSRKVDNGLRAEKDENLVHEARLAELQYADSSNPNAFPPDKVRGAIALVFERSMHVRDGNGERKLHRGYRLLLVTDPKHKSLASASHEVCRRSPLYFEFITDSAANGMAAMVIRIREDTRQCRILLVFSDQSSRQNFYDVLNGLVVGQDESIVGKMTLTGMNIEPATRADGFTAPDSSHPALRSLQWQKLGITNGVPDDPNSRIPNTVQSDYLRIVARHTSGCITDRLNLDKGEMLLRLPCSSLGSLQILRNPQEDMTMSIDTRNSHTSVTDGITELVQLVQQQPTIRTFTFATETDLHAFQTSITGCTVRYDGMASTLSISRRMMVVPIYKKWEASNVRFQIVSRSNDSVIQVLAFMEDFTHASSLCFQVKSTDTFENIKGNNKDKKWAVKMVDAKFTLPHIEANHVEDAPAEEAVEDKVRRRFVNLEGLDYAEEHDDITVGFDSQEDRDRFAQALPAPATVGRGITLKRRT